MPEICEVGIIPEYKGVEIEEIREFCPDAVYAEGTKTEENLKAALAGESQARVKY